MKSGRSAAGESRTRSALRGANCPARWGYSRARPRTAEREKSGARSGGDTVSPVGGACRGYSISWDLPAARGLSTIFCPRRRVCLEAPPRDKDVVRNSSGSKEGGGGRKRQLTRKGFYPAVEDPIPDLPARKETSQKLELVDRKELHGRNAPACLAPVPPGAEKTVKVVVATLGCERDLFFSVLPSVFVQLCLRRGLGRWAGGFFGCGLRLTSVLLL